MISGEDKAFLRDYEIDSNQSFLHFHKVIQDNLKYDSSQLASFFLADEHWNKGLEFTIIDMENDGGPAAIPMDSVNIGDIIKAKKERLLYVYDIYTDNSFFFELMDIFNPVQGIKYPNCSASVGEAPLQSNFENQVYSNDSNEDFIDDIYEDIDSSELDYGSEGFDGDNEEL
ncbi:MAG: hypothetical protein AB9846_00205 [Tenuifilaceae bacterium]